MPKHPKTNDSNATVSAPESHTQVVWALPDMETDNLVSDACAIIDFSTNMAHRTVNWALVQRNWLLGKRIAEEELKGQERAEFGGKTVQNLADELQRIYGKGQGLDFGNLYKYLRFYKSFPQILASPRPKFITTLTWTHFRHLIRIPDETARNWYAKEAAEQSWTVQTLQRNIASQYYYRLLKAPDKEKVEAEMQANTRQQQDDRLEFVKNPFVAEFLGMKISRDYLESDLETCIIGNLQNFMMELGKGFAFVERQKRIVTEVRDYFIDLVFYNYIIKCFVLIDLKTSTITHQDVGQMDMYVRMYDEKFRQGDDHPTLGIILCAETDQDVMRYSVLSDKSQLYASKYLLYLPTPEQLRAEIERQKSLFYLRHPAAETTSPRQ